MSSFLTVYLVDLAMARAVVGSRNEPLRERICERLLPAPMPRPEEVDYGEWSTEQSAEGLAQRSAVTPEARSRVDPYHLKAIDSCAEWMRAVSDVCDRRTLEAERTYGVAGFVF